MLSSRKKEDEKFTKIKNILAAHESLAKEMLKCKKIPSMADYNNSAKNLYLASYKNYSWYCDNAYYFNVVKRQLTQMVSNNRIVPLSSIHINDIDKMQEVLKNKKDLIETNRKMFFEKAILGIEAQPSTQPSFRAATVAEQAKNIMNTEQDTRRNWFTKLTSRKSRVAPATGGKKRRLRRKLAL